MNRKNIKEKGFVLDSTSYSMFKRWIKSPIDRQCSQLFQWSLT